MMTVTGRDYDVPPEARCIACDYPAVDHTWSHPWVMVWHWFALQVVG